MRLFFYGVLIGKLASPDIRRLLTGIGPGRPAMANGRLYAVKGGDGCYPVLVPGRGAVRGMLHEAGRADIASLDAFERCFPDAPERSEYLRRPIAVRMGGRSAIAAQAYIYNRPVSGHLVRIGHGDFARWLHESGNRPISG